MLSKLLISGFSDEISSDFDLQLSTVASLGMKYIALRGIDGKSIGEYSLEEIIEKVLPRLKKAGIGVSSIGSPIGKIFIDVREEFERQKVLLDRLCLIARLLDCKYIRVFSFYIPKGKEPESFTEQVIDKLKDFASIAEKHQIILLHENEKDIYGDTAIRCKRLFDQVDSQYFKGIFDFANFVQCGEDTEEAFHLLRENLIYIHIKDATYENSENVICGTGEGKIPQILKELITSGYEGFLTLEPHLVLFDSLKDLELSEATEVIKSNKAIDGAHGYKLQYEALLDILEKIFKEIG